MFAERKFPSVFSRSFYVFSAVWLGVLFIFLSLFVLSKLANIFIDASPQIVSKYVLLLGTLIIIYSTIHGYNVKITPITLEFNKKRLKKDLRIVHLSDIHLGTINQKAFLDKIVEKTIQQNPDCVMLTGDLVDGSAPITEKMLSPLNKIKVPIFYVIGNHEIYDDLDFVMPILKKTNLTILSNKTLNWKGIQISGVDFHEGSTKAIPFINNLKINKNKFSILLNHAPTGFPEAVKKGFDLELSGHTHNGQIFPFTLLVRIAYKYIAGLYKINNSYINVSQGTGTWGPPMRFLTNSEICVLDLKRK